MKIHLIIPVLSLAACFSAGAQTTTPPDQAHVATPPPQAPRVATTPERRLPTWYVFKIKAFHKVTYNKDRSSAIIEGVTMKDREFKVRVLWDESFHGSHQRTLDSWLKESKEDFQAGIPYVIAGKVVSRDPLTIKPDTMAPHAPNFGAPPENIY